MRCIAVLFLAFAAFTLTAIARPKVAIINVKQAILGTSDAHAAQLGLQTRFDGISHSLDHRAGTDELTLRRQREELQRQFDLEQTRVLQDLGKKMSIVIGKYAARKHYEAVLDVSDPNTPVMWFKKANEITKEIGAEYDRTYSLKTQTTTTARK